MSAFVAIDAIGESLVEELDPGIYVEPRDRHPWPEEARQAPFVVAIRKQRQFRIYAVPNAAKRTGWAAGKAKREGMNPGEPDVGISWADRPTARIEFKNGKDMPSSEQVAALNWYHRRGHPVAVCRTLEGAMAWLASIGAPVTLRVVA